MINLILSHYTRLMKKVDLSNGISYNEDTKEPLALKEIQTVYGTSNPKDLDVLNTVFREEQQVMQTIVDLGLCDEKDIEILNEPTNMKIIQKAVVDYFGEKVARTLLKPQQEKLKRQESADYTAAAKIVKDNLKEFQKHYRKQQALQLWEQKDKDNKTLAV